MKRSYDCGAAKRKKREHVINELSKQKNSLDAFVSRTHVDHQNVVSVTANTDYNTDAEENSCHSLSSANVNAIVVDHFPQAGTPSPPSGYGMTSPFLLVGEYEITDTYATKSEFFFDVNKQTRGSNNNDEEILYRSEDHEIKDELDQFMILAKNENITNLFDMYQLVVRGLQSTFPNVETILRIYLTIPISNASGERSFSVLKRVKNYIRNSIDQDRLGNLALLCIESAETKKANFDQQIDDFARLKCRKKAL